MQLLAEIVTVHTKHPFIIARGGQSEYQVVWVRLIDADGAEGWGEASPSKYYGETADTVMVALQRFAPVLAGADAWSIEAIERELEKAMRWNAAARCAVSAALHDLAARRLGVPLWKMWGLDRQATPISSFTIGIAPMRPRCAHGYVKPRTTRCSRSSSVHRGIVRCCASCARKRKAQLRVDANAAWTAKQALGMLDVLDEVGVDMLEQPLPPQELAGLRFVRERSNIPVVADESCLVASDIPKLRGYCRRREHQAGQVWLLREALRMIAVARAHGMRVMCGCMIETTLGIAAAAHFSPLLDDADLDGAALLSDDPFDGPGIPDGRVVLGDAPGLGVTRRAGN